MLNPRQLFSSLLEPTFMKRAAVLVPVLVCFAGRLGAQSPAPAPAQPVVPSAAATPAASAPTSRKSIIVDKVIVRVNGEIFTQSELVRKQIEALRDKKVQIDDPKALEDDATLGALVQQVT